MRSLVTFAASAVCALGAMNASAFATPDFSHRTIAEIISRSGGDFDSNPFDFDMLLTALQTADLVAPFADPNADLTLFAPNDGAFVRTARDLGYQGSDEEGAWLFLVDTLTVLGMGNPIPVLIDILTYHAVDDNINVIDFIIASFRGAEIETLQGGAIRPRFFRVGDNEPDLSDPFLFFPLNLNASNGVIHTVTRVLIPIDLP